MEQGDYVKFNLALEPFSIEKLNSKLNDVLGHLKYAANVKVASGFVIKISGLELSVCFSSMKKFNAGKPQSTKFLQIQKKHLLQLQEALGRHCDFLFVFEVQNYNQGVNFVNWNTCQEN